MEGTVHAETDNSAVVLGLKRSVYTFQPVADLVATTDFDKRYLLEGEIVRITIL